jgi:protein-disulfide isomerase
MDIHETSTKVILVIVVVFVALLITGAVFWGNESNTPPTPTTVDASNVKTDGEPYIGQANAPVTVIEWSDYQCPACKQFEQLTLPQIMADYVNAGKVRIVFKDFPFLGPDSMVDAEYARAIWALYPTQFFAWRTAIYNQEPPENTLSASANLTFLATVTNSVSGIDLSKVTAAVAANQATYDATINADKTEGTGLGVDATPSFVIGTQLIAGSYPYTTFQAAIDPLLK